MAPKYAKHGSALRPEQVKEFKVGDLFMLEPCGNNSGWAHSFKKAVDTGKVFKILGQYSNRFRFAVQSTEEDPWSLPHDTCQPGSRRDSHVKFYRVQHRREPITDDQRLEDLIL